MKFKHTLYCLVILIFSSCGVQNKVKSDELRQLNLRGPVKSVDQKIYSKVGESDSLKFITYCDRCELHFSSYNFEKQRPDERGGLIGSNAKTYFDKKGNVFQMDFNYNLSGNIEKSYFYKVQSDGVNRAVKKVEYKKDEQVIKEFSYEVDESKGKLIVNGMDTLFHRESFVKNNINNRRLGNEKDYTILNEAGQMIEKKNEYRYLKFEYDTLGRFIRSYEKEFLGGEDYDREDIIEHTYKEGKIRESKFFQINWITKKPNLVMKKTYGYDEFGNMIKFTQEIKGGRDSKHELKIKKYDKFNNWILADYFYDDKDYYLLKRDIDYY